MSKIANHLWFDTQAREAAQFYTSILPNSKVLGDTTLHNTPSGDASVINADLAGSEFILLNAGPYFKFNPSVSFAIACETVAEVDTLWRKFIEGGTVLMELGEYPFSPRYGWLQDKFGLSWQIMASNGQPVTQKITPTLMFVGEQYGKTEAAITFYQTVFKNTKVDHFMRYEASEEPNKEGTIKHAGFSLEGQEFAAMDSALMHDFSFTEAHSFLIHCHDQAEVDYYWEKLSAVPESEQCGWLKDKFGVSWQVQPMALEKMMEDPDPEKVNRVTQAF